MKQNWRQSARARGGCSTVATTYNDCCRVPLEADNFQLSSPAKDKLGHENPNTLTKIPIITIKDSRDICLGHPKTRT